MRFESDGYLKMLKKKQNSWKFNLNFRHFLELVPQNFSTNRFSLFTLCFTVNFLNVLNFSFILNLQTLIYLFSSKNKHVCNIDTICKLLFGAWLQTILYSLIYIFNRVCRIMDARAYQVQFRYFQELKYQIFSFSLKCF